MQQRSLKNVLVSGGMGFIGSNFIRFMLKNNPDFSGRIVNLDVLTYAGNPANLADIDAAYQGSRYFFEQAGIGDRQIVENIFKKYEIDTVVHFAAESHVDRSILGPEGFIRSNIIGTYTLLEIARDCWASRRDVLFHHISTDEVYGSLGSEGRFTETSPYDPRSPYSASKASSDHLVMAWGSTYGFPVTLSNCSNNYGPCQFPEKLIPLSILNMIEGKPLPVYGDGKNIRDWIHVDDHNRAVWTILTKSPAGEKYNIGGENEWENIRLLHTLIDITARKAGLDTEKLRASVTFVKDRPGHDRRYAIDCSKIKKQLGWNQAVPFEEGLGRTVDWYLANPAWISAVRSGEYRNWIKRNYEER
ncbi:MAG: dTDP-glucose 4,6-dehydratase [Treponema sp.]|jgi:dTDP-glucose 4,6-dehydratase|nr:dTDP-glucose 4,6-dehydratase [Treponema sp.]